MKITISGLGATGKSSIAKELATRLGYPFETVGGLFRALAAERGMDVYEFQHVASADPQIDIEIDQRTKTYGETHEDFIFEGWLAWYFIPQSFKVQLVADDALRFKRIAERHGTSVEEAERLTRERERMMFERFQKQYDIQNIADPSHFDVTIDTTTTTTAEAVERVYQEIQKRMTGV